MHTGSDPTVVSLPDEHLWETTVTSFNSSSRIWDDESPVRLNSFGTSVGACAVKVTALGLDQRGLIFIMGGWDPGTVAGEVPSDYVGFDNVTFYDPYIDIWYAQRATGDIPLPRGHFCAVSVPGDNGTYEM